MIRRLFTFAGARENLAGVELVRWLNKQFNQVIVAFKTPASFVDVTTNYVVSDEDTYVFMDASSGALSVTLPPPRSLSGAVVTIKKMDASGNAVTVVATVDGVVDPTLAAQYDAMTLQSNGVVWSVVARV